MCPPDHESIAQQAYRLWEERGRPAGRELAIWLEAEAAMARRESDASLYQRTAYAEGDDEDAQFPSDYPQTGTEPSGRGRLPLPPSPETPPHFVVIVDRAHLRIYHLRAGDETTSDEIELTESFELPVGRQNYPDQNADQAGRFRNRAGPTGGLIDERLSLETESEHRLIVELADQVTNFLEANARATWDYAAGPALHNAILERLPGDVRSRLETILVKELNHQSPVELRTYFTRRRGLYSP